MSRNKHPEFPTLMDDAELDLKVDRPHILSYLEIKQAAQLIDGGIIHTPLCEAKLSKYMDYEIYLKCENLQYSGSCAERGIRNAFVMSHDDYAQRGVIIPSNGNLALAAAYHGGIMNIPVTVALPDRTPPAVSQRCSELGAEVVLVGDSVEDARKYALKVAKESDQVFLSSDDPQVMAGLGTVGMEIVTQLPEVDAVIVPVASGALLASVLIACKKLKCSCLVYGCESAKVPKMMKSLLAGQPVTLPLVSNLAEGLNSAKVGDNAFATIKGRLDRMLVVDEAAVARAMINVLERERLVADGAGVCSIAAVIQGLVPELKGKRTVCIVSGGNIECGRLSRTIQRGLGTMGRLLRFAVAVPDQRSGLVKLAKVISEENAVLKSIVTEQLWLHSDIGITWANVVIETANEEHSVNVKEKLRQIYPTIRFAITDVEEKRKS